MKKIYTEFPTIISNTCWGGMMTNYYGIQYNSVFTGSFMVGYEYLDMLKNWNTIDWENIKVVPNLEILHHQLPLANQELQYPVVILRINSDTYVHVHYPHYDMSYDIKSTWKRRLIRMNFDNLLFKFSKSRLATYDQLKRFCSLELDGQKLLITDNIMKFIRFEVVGDTKVIQSNRMLLIDEVVDEPIESLNNLNWNLFGMQYDSKKILKQLNWI